MRTIDVTHGGAATEEFTVRSLSIRLRYGAGLVQQTLNVFETYLKNYHSTYVHFVKSRGGGGGGAHYNLHLFKILIIDNNIYIHPCWKSFTCWPAISAIN